MQPHIMASLGGLFVIVYLACVAGIIIFVLRLLWRFVTAHEKMATALEKIAPKIKDKAQS